MKSIIASVLFSIVAACLTVFIIKDSPEAQNTVKETVYERVMRTNTIRCGYFVWPPFFVVESNSGKKSGIFYDLTEEMGRKLEVKIEWSQELNFGSYLQDLETGKYDMECTGGWPTATRGKFASYTRNLFYIPLVPFVRIDDDRFVNMQAINTPDVTVAEIDGENSQIIRRQQFPRSKELSLPQTASPAEMMLNVATGKADVAFTDMVFGAQYLKDNPGKLVPLWTDAPLKVIPQNFTIKSEESRFEDMINTVSEEMLLDGTIDNILSRYEDDKPVFKRVSRPYENDQSDSNAIPN